MPDSEARHSLTDLLGSLAGDISGLFRSEIRLAKAEVSEKVDAAIESSRGLAVGALLAVGAVGVFLAGTVVGLASLLVAIGVRTPISAPSEP